jgi:hypothetical protein
MLELEPLGSGDGSAKESNGMTNLPHENAFRFWRVSEWLGQIWTVALIPLEGHVHTHATIITRAQLWTVGPAA